MLFLFTRLLLLAGLGSQLALGASAQDLVLHKRADGPNDEQNTGRNGDVSPRFEHHDNRTDNNGNMFYHQNSPPRERPSSSFQGGSYEHQGSSSGYRHQGYGYEQSSAAHSHGHHSQGSANDYRHGSPTYHHGGGTPDSRQHDAAPPAYSAPHRSTAEKVGRLAGHPVVHIGGLLCKEAAKCVGRKLAKGMDAQTKQNIKNAGTELKQSLIHLNHATEKQYEKYSVAKEAKKKEPHIFQ